jgi:hypothetical protein
MPRDEIVAHLQVDLDGASSEEAAVRFKRQLVAEAGGSVVLRNLAVWRPDGESGPSPLPSPLPRHLEAFFAGVARTAAVEEEIFRRQVGAIFASDGPGAFDPDRDEHPAAGPTRLDDGVRQGAAAWEDEGGSIDRDQNAGKEIG